VLSLSYYFKEVVMNYHQKALQATRAQLACLREIGIDVDALGWLSADQANALIREHANEWNELPATLKQKHFLLFRRLWVDGMTRGDAARLIAKCEEEENKLPGWKPPKPLDGPQKATPDG
jgi:hypothetical protein